MFHSALIAKLSLAQFQLSFNLAGLRMIYFCLIQPLTHPTTNPYLLKYESSHTDSAYVSYDYIYDL